MKKQTTFFKTAVLISTILLLSLIIIPFSSSQAAERYQLTILGTTDMHQNLLPYDYMSDEPNEEVGFSKIYTLIEQQRDEKENTILLSAGDVIQGSLIGDYEFRINPIEEGETQTIVEAFNFAGYKAVSVGNHELQDFPLWFFERALDGAEFDWLSANIKKYENDELYLKPYEVYEKDLGGRTINIGVISFTPPQTFNWGRDHLEGKLYFKPIIEQAEKFIPELKEKSDIIIVSAHTGLAAGYRDATENAGYYVSKIDGIDAMVLGHDHIEFPGGYEDFEGVDNEIGTVNGVPTVMAGSWGSALGVIDLDLEYNDGWNIVSFNVSLIKNDETVESHPKIEEIAQEVHQGTLDYIRTPVAETDKYLTSYFVRVKDSAITQVINDAQLRYGENFIASHPEYQDYGLLAAAASFRFGREGPRDYTRIEREIRVSDITDIYMYPNEVRIVELNGEQVLDWLEHSAKNFNQIDPNNSERQGLINWDLSGSYYDILEGIEYEIDITQPEGQRIFNATYKGDPLTANKNFLVITNNHRASGGGDFPHLDGETIIYRTATTHQELLIEHIDNYGIADSSFNWRIKPFEHEGDLIVRTHPEGEEYIEERNLNFLEFIEIDNDGWGIYRYNFDGF